MRRALVLALPLAALLGACSEPTPLIKARCGADDDCEQGLLCEDGACVEPELFRCDGTSQGMAILQPAPHVVDFGSVGGTRTTREIVLRNIGECALTVFEANLHGESGAAFECEGCGEGRFPVEIFPMREHRLKVGFLPPGVGSFADKLEILSDDTEFPRLLVPLRAHFDGAPALRATPEAIDFGYLAKGRQLSRSLRLANKGTGVAALNVVAIRVEPSGLGAFSLEGSPALPARLDPLEVDPLAGLSLSVAYHPQEVGSHRGYVVIETDSEDVGIVSLPLSGTSETPPSLSVSHEQVQFGEVQLGRTSAARVITLNNQGGSPLTVAHRWAGGSSADLVAQPAVLAPIDPGAYAQLELLVTPTGTGAIAGVLVLESNDPARGSVSLPVSATGVASAGTQVIKVELSYENGAEGSFDSDLRNVDLTLEHPYGFVCNKQEPDPTTWGEYGTPSWMAYGIKEEPERIILVDPQRDGRYRVMVHYAQDCSSLPTDLLASLLGMSVEALAGGLSSGTIVLDGGEIGEMIEGACFSRSDTDATVTVYLNGQVIAEKPVTLQRRGDFAYAAEIVRQGGQIRVQ